MTSTKPDTREWAKVATDLPEHPKLAALEDPAPAGWTAVVGILYCRKHLTDGVIPVAGVLRKASVTRDVADQLVTVDIWHLPDHSCQRCPQPPAGHAYVHDYLEHNQSRAQVEAARAAGRKAANVRHARRHSTSEDPSSDPHADRNADPVRVADLSEAAAPADTPAPTDRTAERMRVVSDPQEPTGSHADRMRIASDSGAEPHAEVEVEEELTTDPPALRAGPPARTTRGSRLDPAWRPAEAVRTALADECPGVDLLAEFRKFLDYWTAVPGAKGRKLDWDATFRNWVRRAAETAPTASRRPPGRQTRADKVRAAVSGLQDRYGADVIALPPAIGGDR